MKINQINSDSTSRELRLLAKEIDEGNPPDFYICVCRDNEIKTSHRAEDAPFELIGAIEYRKQLVIEEIE